VAKNNHRPAYLKKFGQHHLRSGALCRPLVEFLAPAGELVLEVGPGGGILTAELLAAGARVLGWELDRAWAFHLAARRLPSLSVVLGDATRFPWERLERRMLAAGNLPFNVGTAILEQAVAASARRPDLLPRLGFMVQKEVGDRLRARPGDPAWGALSALVQVQAEVTYLATVAPGSFVPPPKVAAAFLGFRPRPPLLPPAEQPAFRGVVHLAFAQRRKMLRNSLESGWQRERTAAVLQLAGIDGRRRAETLEIAELLELHRAAKKIAAG
jgi:16S rRNA (adenine1518-N6/adenine1519-N6)-dimethyltransferase